MNKEIKIRKKLKAYKNNKIIKGGVSDNLKGLDIKKQYEAFGLKLYKNAQLTEELVLEEYYTYTLDSSDNNYYILVFDENKFKNLNVKMFKTEKEKEKLIILKINKTKDNFIFDDNSDIKLIKGYNIKKKYENIGLKLYKDVDLTQELSLEEYYTYTSIFKMDEEKKLYFYYISIVDNTLFNDIKTIKDIKPNSLKESEIFNSFKTKVIYDQLGLKVYKDENYTEEYTLYDYYIHRIYTRDKKPDEKFNIKVFNNEQFLKNIDIINNDIFFTTYIIYNNLLFLKEYLNSTFKFKYYVNINYLKEDTYSIIIIINTLINLIKYLAMMNQLFDTVYLSVVDSSEKNQEYLNFKKKLIELYFNKLQEYKFIINIEDLERADFTIEELFQIIFMQEQVEYNSSIDNKLKNVKLEFNVSDSTTIDLIKTISEKNLLYTFSIYTLNYMYVKLLLQLKIIYETELRKKINERYGTFFIDKPIDKNETDPQLIKLKATINTYGILIKNLPSFISDYFFIDILRFNSIKLNDFSINKCINKCINIILFCNLLNILYTRNNEINLFNSLYKLPTIDFGV